MTTVLDGVIGGASGPSLISGVAPGAETFGSAADLAAYQMMNNAGVDPQAIANIFSSQPYLQEGIAYMSEIFRPGGSEKEQEEFLHLFGSGPQAVVKVANSLKAAHHQWGQLMFLMKAGGTVRKKAFKQLYVGSGPGDTLPRLKKSWEEATRAEGGDENRKRRLLWQRLRQGRSDYDGVQAHDRAQ